MGFSETSRANTPIFSGEACFTSFCLSHWTELALRSGEIPRSHWCWGHSWHLCNNEATLPRVFATELMHLKTWEFCKAFLMSLLIPLPPTTYPIIIINHRAWNKDLRCQQPFQHLDCGGVQVHIDVNIQGGPKREQPEGGFRQGFIEETSYKLHSRISNSLWHLVHNHQKVIRTENFAHV